MPIYHYYATKQLDNGNQSHIDGIATLKKPVLTMSDYIALKQKIAEGQGIGGEYGLVIVSLNLLQD